MIRAACGLAARAKPQAASAERHDDASDVVVGAALQRQHHQFVRPFLRIVVTRRADAQIFRCDEIRQTIAGQNETVAGFRRERVDLRRIRQIGAAEKLVEYMAIGTLPRCSGVSAPLRSNASATV